MRKFVYDEPGEESGSSVTTVVTEDQIINDFWEEWKAKIIKIYGSDTDLLTRQNCIEDWCEIHGAWEYD